MMGSLTVKSQWNNASQLMEGSGKERIQNMEPSVKITSLKNTYMTEQFKQNMKKALDLFASFTAPIQ